MLEPQDGDTAAMMLNCGEGNLAKIAEYLSVAKGEPVTVEEVVKAIRESVKRDRALGLL